MKKITQLFFALVLSLVSNLSFGQCPGCNIDTTINTPGIYPSTLPNGTQMAPYSKDVTFVMFLDTSGFAVNYFKILSVTGLPFGLNWECNNFSTGCTYDPNVNIRGCVKICGTPIAAGSFTIDVNLLINLATVGNVNSTTQLFITIDPATGGNTGFSFSPAVSCDTALVTYTALISGAPNPTTYSWDFDNGNTSTAQNPPPQLYATPGDYYPTLTTNILGYKITDVNLFTLNSNWAGDVEEPSTTFFSPDPYFQIFNSLSANLFTSPFLSGTESGSWNSLNIILTDPPYSITMWDDDNVSVDDNLGSFPFSVSGPGSIPFSGAGGTSGNLIVSTYVISSFTNVDTIHVYGPPSAGVVSVIGSDTICAGDSTTLSVSGFGSNTIQWYNDTTLIINADSSYFTVHQTGNYWAQLTNPNGCTSTSNSQFIFVAPNPLNPTFLISGNALTCYTTGYALQWNLNGVPIPGANSAVYNILVTGNYSVTATNVYGCSSTSIVVLATFMVGIEEIDVLNQVVIFPNPSKDEFNINADERIIGMKYSITDNIGRVLTEGVFTEMNSKISCQNYKSGIYFLTIIDKAKKTFILMKE